MTSQNRSRREYTARINKALDYIDKNIGEELRLEALAKEAHFSSYHFHRIFSSIVGEPLYKYILRVRLEKAAAKLLGNPDDTIAGIATDCGFSSPATFARAFKEYFGATATEARQKGYQLISKNRKQVGKICKQDSKNNKDSELQDDYFCDAVDCLFKNNIWRLEMKGEKPIETNVEVKELPAMDVVYIRHIGPYKGDNELFGQLFGRLFQWAGPRGLLNFPEAKILTLYHDDPEITDEEKLRISVCISAPADTKVDGEIGKMKVEGGKYAVAHFEIDASQYGDAWNMIFGEWLPQSGYQCDDRLCYELYLNDPEHHPEKKHIVDICIPVKPL